MNNMTIILSGGGSGEKSKELDEKFASLLDKNKPLLYIPVAIDEVKHPYPECLKWLRSTFDKLGVIHYEMLTEKELVTRVHKPEKFAGVYIGGGNTFYLLKTLKKTNFWKFLRICVKKGIPIYGGSAGAIIFGYSILAANDLNEVNLTNFDGMNLLKGISIFCHYKPEKEEILNRMILGGVDKVIALPETSGICLEIGKKPKIIGKDSAWLFYNKDKLEIKVGQEF